jgi:putative hydrolase of the HAD superfamily
MDLQSARRDVVKLALEKLNCRDDTYAFEIADRYSQLRNELIYVFPGARETLARFCARDIPLALITNGTAAEQRAKLARFDLAWYFQAILIEGEVGLGKPDERVFQLCLDKFRLRANQVWMVGDNLEWDVAAPQRVGIHSIWNDCKGRGLLPDSPIVPDRIVRSISEIVF